MTTFIIPAEDLLSDRRTKRKELKIPGCRKMHKIAVNKEGITTQGILNSNDNSLYTLKFDDAFADVDEEMNVIDNIYDDEKYNNILDKEVLFSIIEGGTYIGLRSQPKSIEMFYVV